MGGHIARLRDVHSVSCVAGQHFSRMSGTRKCISVFKNIAIGPYSEAARSTQLL
jgi:hypothetical protein